MLIKDLKRYIFENYEDGVKREIRDALVSLKIQGMHKVSTIQVLKDFSQRGIKIGIADLINMFQGDPLVQDINREEITFSTEVPDPVTNPEKEEVTDEEKKNTIRRMARRAIGRKFNIRTYKR